MNEWMNEWMNEQTNDWIVKRRTRINLTPNWGLPEGRQPSGGLRGLWSNSPDMKTSDEEEWAARRNAAGFLPSLSRTVSVSELHHACSNGDSVAQWLAMLPHSNMIVGSIPGLPVSAWVQALRLPPTDQKHLNILNCPSWLWVNEWMSEWLFVCIRPCNELVTGCHPAWLQMTPVTLVGYENEWKQSNNKESTTWTSLLFNIFLNKSEAYYHLRVSLS